MVVSLYRIEGNDRQRDTLSEPYKKYMERKRSGTVHVSQHRPSLVRQTLHRVGALTSTEKSMDTDKPVVIIWDGLNVEERESSISWMTTSKSWVLWKQHDSLSTTKNRVQKE